jgi:hypothetical protein
LKHTFAFCFGDWNSFDDVTKQEIQSAAMDALIAADRAYLEDHPGTPALYNAGVVFIAEKQPGELNRWCDVATVLAQGGSHCVGLTAWRVAELQNQGEDARATIRMENENKPGFGVIEDTHFLVVREDGTLEDPSLNLGMAEAIAAQAT